MNKYFKKPQPKWVKNDKTIADMNRVWWCEFLYLIIRGNIFSYFIIANIRFTSAIMKNNYAIE